MSSAAALAAGVAGLQEAAAWWRKRRPGWPAAAPDLAGSVVFAGGTRPGLGELAVGSAIKGKMGDGCHGGLVHKEKKGISGFGWRCAGRRECGLERSG